MAVSTAQSGFGRPGSGTLTDYLLTSLWRLLPDQGQGTWSVVYEQRSCDSGGLEGAYRGAMERVASAVGMPRPL